MLKKIIDTFGTIPDTRVIGRTTFSLKFLLSTFFIAALTGASGWKDTHLFAISNFLNLKRLFPDLIRIPGVDTIARTISHKVDLDKFCRAILELAKLFLKRNSPKKKPGRPKKADNDSLGEFVSIDGKTVRGAVRPGDKKSKIHLVNALCSLVFMLQEWVHDKTNEIPIAFDVINTLGKSGMLKGKCVTMDAMGCQKKTVEAIVSFNADYLIGLKGNQGGMYEHAKILFEDGLAQCSDKLNPSTYQTDWNKEHGRIESRKITVIPVSSVVEEWVPEVKHWKGLKYFIKVERIVESTSGKKSREEVVRYYITSLALSPKKLLQAVIKHWSVETFHFILDKTFHEDQCKIYQGKGAQMFSCMRKFALNFIAPIAKLNTGESVATIVELMRRCWDFLVEVIDKRPDEVPPPKSWRIAQGKTPHARIVPELAA
jgi:predicted transposase YbfD/YdcC